MLYPSLSQLEYNVKGFVGEREGDSEVLVMEERGREMEERGREMEERGREGDSEEEGQQETKGEERPKHNSLSRAALQKQKV